jgi:hypothetical protein
MNILLRDFSAKLGREDIFKPTIGMKVYMKFGILMGLEQQILPCKRNFKKFSSVQCSHVQHS